MEIRELLKIKKENLSNSDLSIVNYLLKNQEDIIYVTSKDISEKLGISETTLSRFWRKIGFKNIKDFKQNLKTYSAMTPAAKIQHSIDKLKNNNITDIMNKNVTLINKTFMYMNEDDIKKASDLICKAANIYIYAPDASFGIAKVFEYRLKRFGIYFKFINNGSALYEDLINITKNDLVILFCYAKIIPEVQVILENSLDVKYKIIVFTDLISSALNDYNTLIFYNYRGEPTEYHSMVSCLSTLDCIILEIALIKNKSMDNIRKLNRVRTKYNLYLKR